MEWSTIVGPISPVRPPLLLDVTPAHLQCEASGNRLTMISALSDLDNLSGQPQSYRREQR
jgi:hypothetical protein